MSLLLAVWTWSQMPDGLL